MTWDHRLYQTKDGTLKVVECHYWQDGDERVPLGWSNPFVEDLTPIKLARAKMSPILTAKDFRRGTRLMKRLTAEVDAMIASGNYGTIDEALL